MYSGWHAILQYTTRHEIREKGAQVKDSHDTESKNRHSNLEDSRH
jgi:hypothetical protein